MKVIAKTAHGFLVEATEDEIARAAGYSSTWSIPSLKERNGRSWAVGDIVDVTETHQYLAKLRDHERKVKESAALLRAMADMVESALPTTIVIDDTAAQNND